MRGACRRRAGARKVLEGETCQGLCSEVSPWYRAEGGEREVMKMIQPFSSSCSFASL